MDLGLKDRTALVTGASMGIGKAVALALAGEGASVVIAARHADALDEAAADIRRTTGAHVQAITADCAIATECDRLVTEATEALGRVDILVNAIGMARGGDFLRLSDQEWDESLALKLMGQIRCCRAVVPQMMRRGWGRIVNISGTQWKRPLPTSMPAGVANAGLVNFTKALAELAGPRNVLVNVVSPGPIHTRRIEYLIQQRAATLGASAKEMRAELVREVTLGRFGEPIEVARVIVFLASEASTFIHGAVIDVDGGYTKCL
jgi:NAD(P)-dependent dehydrogenase (short-subunit alcohol dehydrogenase family)